MYRCKISSFNCRSVKNSLRDVLVLCDMSDIIFLQEHWLPVQNLSYLNSIHPDFVSIGSSPVDFGNGLLVGRPYGGLGILYKKSLSSYIKVVDKSDTSFLCVELKCKDRKVLLINCYLPHYDDGRNLEIYINLLYKINSLILASMYSDVIILGDFNCDINSILFNELVVFCGENSLNISDVDILKEESNSFTYVSDATGNTRWLDHVVTSSNMHRYINDIQILYNFILSDHRPVIVEFNFALDSIFSIEGPSLNSNVSNCNNKINWSLLSEPSISQYKLNTFNYSNLSIPDSVISLNETDKTKISKDITNYYNEIIGVFSKSSLILIPNRNISNTNTNRNIPGWNLYVKDNHDRARDWFSLWCDIDKPKSGHIYEIMKFTRSRFKNSLKFCKRNEKKIINDKIGMNFAQKDMNNFWKEIKKQNKNIDVLPSEVEGISGTYNIAEYWKRSFKEVLTSVPRGQSVHASILDIDEGMLVNVSDVIKAVQKLSSSESSGFDKVTSNHIKHAHCRILIHLSLLFTAMFRYSFIPSDLMKVIIVPIVKSKCGDLSSKDNYRPISLSTVISKLFEQIIIFKLENLLYTTDNQFAFKKSHSTEMCVFALKQVIFEYNKYDTPIFACFLDIKKAFDRINNDTMLNILRLRNFPEFIIRILEYWFKNQVFYIKWQNAMSSSFQPTCGLRQGSILSPVLFNLYIDNLSVDLNNSGVGCNFNNKTINHLCYADDLVLFTPSAKSLQYLIDICRKFGSDFDVKFNVLKTKCMTFLLKTFKFNKNPDNVKFYLYDEIIECVKSFNYLGIIINDNLNDNDEIKQQYRKTCIRSNTLIRKFNDCSFEVKNELFKSFCTPIYGRSLWCNFTKKVYNSMRVCYNNAYRFLHGLPRFCSASFMFGIASVPSFHEIMRKGQLSLMRSLFKSQNSLISVLSEFNLQSNKLWSHWNNNLYL